MVRPHRDPPEGSRTPFWGSWRVPEGPPGDLKNGDFGYGAYDSIHFVSLYSKNTLKNSEETAKNVKNRQNGDFGVLVIFFASLIDEIW